MKKNGSLNQHLVLRELVMLPGGEWSPRLPGWTFAYVSRGIGYWLHPHRNQELVAGSALVFSDCVQGLIRASQLGETAVLSFCVQPERLSGVITLLEQKVLREETTSEDKWIRHFPPDEPLARNFKALADQPGLKDVRRRLLMLDLFVQAFDRELELKRPEPAAIDGAKARLQLLLCQMHPVDMLDQSFTGLAARVGCTPRHLGRLFQEVVGASFREKQTEARLGKAMELLSTTDSKVVEVALESGYQSLSLFNLMFKRRFGVTPARWRERGTRRGLAG